MSGLIIFMVSLIDVIWASYLCVCGFFFFLGDEISFLLPKKKRKKHFSIAS